MTNNEFIRTIFRQMEPVQGPYMDKFKWDWTYKYDPALGWPEYHWKRLLFNDIEVIFRCNLGNQELITTVRGRGANFNRTHTVYLNQDDSTLEEFILSATA